MASLNYKHLHYFWTVAKSGGVGRAAESLHVTAQSISGQLRLLEEQVGARLLRRAGRGVELTETGRMVFEYADRAFTAGDELVDALRSRRGELATTFRVGVSNVLGRSVAFSMLQPALSIPDPPKLLCREGRLPDLLGELAMHRLDMVLSDRPTDASVSVRAFNHLLIDCGIAVLAAPSLAARLRGPFPRCLHDAPWLLHGEESGVRPRLMRWFEGQGIQPRIVAEFDDTALLKAFAQEGVGVFSAPTLVAEEICAALGVIVVGGTEEVREQAFAISVERRLSHPAVLAISEAARQTPYGVRRAG
ncbi:MAG: transcriptional activator NhaR [Burkholderiales bacterium]|jgi:LysR family transcriptional activator of nhaA